MASTNRWILTDDSNGIDPTGFTSPVDSAMVIRKCESHLGRGAQGAMACNLKMALNPVAAQATVTLTGTATAADTITVGNVAFTYVSNASTPTSVQMKIGASATDSAANFVAAVNAYSGLAGVCTASNLAGVITLTAAIPGTIGNGLALAVSLTAGAITHAFGASVAGSEGTSATFSLGK